ncbi:MAG: hypothetical protein J6G98_05210 [Bacilli bacterium]|nr:hypothetical protein [Bacilli bacterium]
MNTFDKFIVTSRMFSINEFDTNDLFLNFCMLDNKYQELLNYNFNEMKLYQDIVESAKNGHVEQLNRILFITMDDEKADEITKLMTIEEKKGFCNLTKDYIKLNMQRDEKKKSL